MTYLVMENHLSYSVVLSESGQFLKVANRGYEVGQKVTDVIVMPSFEYEPTPRPKVSIKKWLWVPTLALIFTLVFVTLFYVQVNTTYASVSLTISPSVRLELNRFGDVIRIVAEDEEAKAFVADYEFHKKPVDDVVNDLIDLSLEKGYITSETKVEVVVKSSDQKINEDLTESITKNIDVKLQNVEKPIVQNIEPPAPAPEVPVIAPVETAEPKNPVPEKPEAPVVVQKPAEKKPPMIIKKPETNESKTPKAPVETHEPTVPETTETSKPPMIKR
ncbi:anti-sigma-I factor RsgI family protein [Guggenheimella bovis]